MSRPDLNRPETIRIKVIEDEALIAEEICQSLQELGFTVEPPSYTYDQGALAVQQSDAHLFVLDMNLGEPGKGGLQLAELLHAAGKPFIFITAYNTIATIREAIDAGAQGYLIKPVYLEPLFACVQTALAKSYGEAPPTPDTTTPPDPPDYAFVDVRGQRVRVDWKEVQYLESGKNYVTVHPMDDRLSFALRGTIASVIEERFPTRLRPEFVRISRRVAVNRTYVTHFDDTRVYLGTLGFEYSGLNPRQLEQLLMRGRR